MEQPQNQRLFSGSEKTRPNTAHLKKEYSLESTPRLSISTSTLKLFHSSLMSPTHPPTRTRRNDEHIRVHYLTQWHTDVQTGVAGAQTTAP